MKQGSKTETSCAPRKDGTEEEVAVNEKEEIKDSDGEGKQRRSTRNARKAKQQNAAHAATTMETVSQKISGRR